MRTIAKINAKGFIKTEIVTLTVVIGFRKNLKSESTNQVIATKTLQTLIINWSITKTKTKCHQMTTKMIIVQLIAAVAGYMYVH